MERCKVLIADDNVRSTNCWQQSWEIGNESKDRMIRKTQEVTK
jgi:hypothetical protein